MKRSAALATLVLGAVVGLGPAAPASAAPYCGISWGSLPEVVEVHDTGQLVGIRTGRHACYDRLVVDVSGNVSGYRAGYVDQVHTDGEGAVVPLRGGARIQLVALVPAYDPDYRSSFDPVNPMELADVSGYQTFKQVAWAGSFEGQSTLGVGVRARLPFRVFMLDGPGSGSRLVLDVAHRW